MSKSFKNLCSFLIKFFIFFDIKKQKGIIISFKKGNKFKKNFVVLIIIILLTSCLVACEPARFYYSYGEFKEEVIEVDVYQSYHH